MAANGISANIHDHGSLVDKAKQRVKCHYCDKVVSTFHRLKCHLGAIRGDVTPCSQVPEDVKEVFRTELTSKKQGSLKKDVGELFHPDLPLKRNWSPAEATNRNEPELIRASASGSRKQIKMNFPSENNGNGRASLPSSRTIVRPSVVVGQAEGSSSREVQKCIGRFFYESGISFSSLGSPSFRKIIGFPNRQVTEIPSLQDLKGWIFQDLVKEMQQYVKEVGNSWEQTGCSVLLDEWEDAKHRKLLNILVNCPKGTVYLRSADISSIYGDIEAMQSFFDEICREVGLKNVVQIVAYPTTACMKEVGQNLMEKHRTFFWTLSASHCVELMLEKFGMMGHIKHILEKAKNITRFVYAHPSILELMRNHCSVSDLTSSSKIRSTRPFLTLENIVLEKENLWGMLTSPDWMASSCTSTREVKTVYELMEDELFWNGADEVLKATIPLVSVLNLLNQSNKPQMGLIYETMDQMKETIQEEFGHDESRYLRYWNVIDEVWDGCFHSHLHAAGYYLNPNLLHASDFSPDTEVVSGLLVSIVRMVKERAAQDMISMQMEDYKSPQSAFCELRDAQSDLSPEDWWWKHGSRCPELQSFAIRVLSQTCDGALKYGLDRSVAESLFAKGMNPIEEQRLKDKAFLHYNLQLQKFRPDVSNDLSGEIDPTDDWLVYKDQTLVPGTVEAACVG